MPKKIRVYELAKELGLTNKEGLELALSLGIGVKSHSSSIEDAQADRVRRKADADGLRRPVQPEEPAAAKKAAKKAAPAAKKAAGTAKAAPEAGEDAAAGRIGALGAGGGSCAGQESRGRIELGGGLRPGQEGPRPRGGAAGGRHRRGRIGR